MSETNVNLPNYNQLEQLQAYEQYLLQDENNSPPLNHIDVPSSSRPNPPIVQSQVDGTRNAHPGDPIVDPFINNEMFEDDFQTNPSTRSSNYGKNAIQLSTWPLQVSPYTCSCCQVLREISHTNGIDITKLEVHGRIGVICHAILDKYSVDLNANENQSHEYKMFDFCKESIIRVKSFLEEYCKERKTNGYITLQDPLSNYYEAVCVGLDWMDSLVTDDLIPNDSGGHQMNQPQAESSIARHPNRTNLSIQRERTGKLTMRDLVNYFNIPIELAAKEINVCPTVIKKICRKHGLSRWPYRKIKSIEKKISVRATYLTSVDVEERSRAQADIDKLRQELTDLYSTFNV
ncbi:uncharacterized protein [Rutidosis leptorrhynchoides]|uniref:uncharacterized protein n=1 Tax=Rutidosis leptorrhynchoides TaxID=125765 RepID=UPI003A99E929